MKLYGRTQLLCTLYDIVCTTYIVRRTFYGIHYTTYIICRTPVKITHGYFITTQNNWFIW